MDGRGLKDFAFRGVFSNDSVFFMDKDGGIHEIYSVKRVRDRETGPCVILMEIGTIVRDFGELKTEKPPQALIDYIKEKGY